MLESRAAICEDLNRLERRPGTSWISSRTNAKSGTQIRVTLCNRTD